MRRLIPLALIAVLAIGAGLLVAQTSVSVSPVSAHGFCRAPAPQAFCDTFDTPSTGGREGDLNALQWSVARLSQHNNPSKGLLNTWHLPEASQFCVQTVMPGFLPPADSFFCGTQFGESMHWMTTIDDNGAYIATSAMIRQPFDTASRTGTFTFAVDAKTAGSHSSWVEVWLTDEPVPAPHDDTPGMNTPPRNGIGFRLRDVCNQTTPMTRTGPPGLVIVQNYTRNITSAYTSMVKGPNSGYGSGCIATQDDNHNELEFRVTANATTITALEVLGSNVGDPTLRRMGIREGLSIPFTRGFWHVQQVQYNAAKAAANEAMPGSVTPYQTYHWDNLSFDGPLLPTPRSVSVPDALTPSSGQSPSAPGDLNLGYRITAAGLTQTCCTQPGSVWTAATITAPGVDPSGMTTATLTLNVRGFTSTNAFEVEFNGSGVWLPVPYPFPYDNTGWRYAIVGDIPVSLLVQGPNTIRFRGTAVPATEMGVANIDLLME